MFRKFSNKPAQDGQSRPQEPTSRRMPPSIIAADVNLLGNVISSGSVDMDGTLDGNIRCKHLTLRKNGVIKGDVTAESANISGRVEGMLRVKHVNLYESCNVLGVIVHESLTIEDGAFVDGQFKRLDKVTLDDAYDTGYLDNESDEIFKRLKLIEA